MTFSRQLNLYQPLKFIGYVGEPKEIGFVVRKDDTELLNKLNTGIENVRNTDEFKAILDRYNLQYKKDVYVVGISDKNKPWSYLGSDGKYAGYDIEQIEWIADNYDFDVEYKVSTPERSLNDIIVGDIDMWASSMEITPERLQYAAFSDPYYKSGSEEYGIATSNGNVVLQNLLNEGLAEFEKSGKKAEVLKKYGL
ncbi:MAG: transporter substrate-binding domain-containing protein, partial [Methanocorpusculum sp.]|nr:transporter substrate-binding domain-containing protein [Methanocorpusculum sp.]